MLVQPSRRSFGADRQYDRHDILIFMKYKFIKERSIDTTKISSFTLSQAATFPRTAQRGGASKSSETNIAQQQRKKSTGKDDF